MRKPVSKNSFRRAFDKALADGQIQCSVPVNTVVDSIWHDLEKENYNGTRKKPSPRRATRTAPVPELAEVEITDA